MPRPRGGGQPVRAAAGLPYGQGQELAEAQRAIPLADNRAQTTAAATANQTPAVPQAASAPGLDQAGGLLAQAEAAAAATPNATGLLAAPSTRPDEPLTAGLPIGAGPGPQAIQGRRQQQASVASYLAIAAEVFGNDPLIAELAQRARDRGL